MKINKALQYLLGGIAVLVFFAIQTNYNPFRGSGEKGEIVSLKEFKTLLKDKASDGRRVAMIAHTYILDRDITLEIGEPLDLIFSTAYPDDSTISIFPLPFDKDGKNACYLPGEFQAEDFVIYDNEGNALPYGEDLLLSFTLKRIKSANPEMNEQTGEYVWNFDQIRIDPIAN